MVFFENTRCLKCESQLGFLPDVLDLSALEADANNQWRAISPLAKKGIYRECANRQQHKICNWMVRLDDPNPFCASCRLNEMIPGLSDANNIARWEKLELAKRRCLYTFMRLGLPVENTTNNGQRSLRFRFLQDTEGAPVQTGHENGVITINIAEADGDERERRRLAFHEPYRTLVGHFRHESGHFYWDRLIANSTNLESFRNLFGDETVDYAAALKKYYQQGPAKDWPERTVTAYASSHPWEDWAETWAHYLHIMDTMETAASFGIGVRAKIPRVTFNKNVGLDVLLNEWVPLTCALNAINRGMGLPDLYPFVIPPRVVEKLRFIHAVIHKLAFQNTEQRQAISERKLAA
jgi:hypothetical protein